MWFERFNALIKAYADASIISDLMPAPQTIPFTPSTSNPTYAHACESEPTCRACSSYVTRGELDIEMLHDRIADRIETSISLSMIYLLLVIYEDCKLCLNTVNLLEMAL